MSERSAKRRATELDIDFSLDNIVSAPVAEMETSSDELDFGAEGVQEEGTEQGLDRKKVLILAAAVVLLLSIVAGVYFYFFYAPKPKVEEQKHEEIAIIPKQEEKKKAYAPPPSFTVDPFYLPEVDSEGKSSFLQVSVELILSNEYLIKDLTKNVTDLRQNLMYVFANKTAEDIQDEKKRDQLKKEIMIAANRVLQRGTVYEVYFISYSLQ